MTICFYDMLWFTHCFSQEKYPFFVLGTYLHYVEKLNENVRIFSLFLFFVTKNHDEMWWQKSVWYDIWIVWYVIATVNMKKQYRRAFTFSFILFGTIKWNRLILRFKYLSFHLNSPLSTNQRKKSIHKYVCGFRDLFLLSMWSLLAAFVGRL